MKEQILELLTANNYPLGEDSDDVQCANQINTLTRTHYLQFVDWLYFEQIMYAPSNKDGILCTVDEYYEEAEWFTIEQVYDYWLNLNL
jgi:hypothetical protein